jgi:acetate kinase
MPDAPVVFFFETAFFADLPARERIYGLDADMTKALGLRRFGFHGIFHEAACREASRRPRAGNGGTDVCEGERGRRAPARILSICLEPRPELAAVIGSRPVMVTSGATPLEGLPGETTCGEIDPSIVLTLARKLHWGPEEVNAALTRDSGLTGLVGRPVTFAEAFTSSDGEVKSALEIFKYRLLLACGAGLAAMGGVDAVVFSGRYARLGATLAPWLADRLEFPGVTRKAPIRTVIFEEPLDRILADSAPAAVLSGNSRAA